MVRPCFVSIAAALCCAFVSCVEGASSDPGLSAQMRVQDAQYVPGAMPGASEGPEIVTVRAPHDQVFPGLRQERLTGALSRDASAVAVGLEQDRGYWIITAGVPSIEEPEYSSFEAILSFSPDLSPGTFDLNLRAVDRTGRFGPERKVRLEAIDSISQGELVVRLAWDNNADLDLHVIDPSGEEVWSGNINTMKPAAPGAPADPEAWKQGGMLDLDSNGGCLIDGRREENAIWQASPPVGTYVVRVATASLCAASSAPWKVEVWLGQRRIAKSQGIGLPSDTRAGQGRGSGVFALSFDVP